MVTEIIYYLIPDPVTPFTKLISINGPTSSGKTKLSIELAKTIPGAWIVNADSRQVYKRLNIGTGKVAGEWLTTSDFPVYSVEGIPHTLIDFVDPVIRYNLVDFVRDFKNFCESVHPHTVIVVGGSGLYLDTITSTRSLEITRTEHSDDHSNYKKHLTRLDLDSLQQKVGAVAISLNRSDYHNPRRLVNRLLEYKSRQEGWLTALQVPQFTSITRAHIDLPWEKLQSRISTRLEQRYIDGLVPEVEGLQDLGTTRLLELGLEYRLTQLYLLGQLDYDTYRARLLQENIRLAKRQLTWLKNSLSIPVSGINDILKLSTIDRTE